MTRTPTSPTRGALSIVCIVPFLDEERHLRRFLRSMAAQERPPDLLVLVDDGSSDASPAIAADWARSRPNVRVRRLPARPRARDRLAHAGELRAFQCALAEIDDAWDVAVKLDADLELSPDLFSTMERAFLSSPDLGIAGAYLSLADPVTGGAIRERCPPQHVRGATKFYRRSCLEEIAPLPAILGWDTIDELAARKRGWRTASLDCPSGQTLHLRGTGSADGLLRAQYRWGVCAYGIGQHPLWVALSTTRRLADRPYLLGAAAFLAGWASAPLRRRPRAPGDVRAYGRREQLAILRRRARRVMPV
jgi:glycosyltransferase involved in cell wall biosynthesis